MGQHAERTPAQAPSEPIRRMPLLRVEVLGRFHWSLDGQRLPEPSPVGRAALSYLLVHAGESVPHAEMEALFTLLAPHAAEAWLAEAQALGRAVPPSLLRVTGTSIRLSPHVTSDLADAATLIEGPRTSADLQRAWLLLTSEFLEDLPVSDRPIWDVWLDARRGRLRKDLIFVTEQLGLNAVEPAIHFDRAQRSTLVH